MSVIRKFALPVVVVFGSLIAYAGVVAGVAAAQGPDSYHDEFADGGDTESDGFTDGADDGAGSDGGVSGDGEVTDPGTTVEEEPPPVSSALPATCDSLFSSSMRGKVEGAGLVLNPSWASPEGSSQAITDGTLRSKLADLPQLNCRWLNPEGGGEVGIETTVAVVTPAEADAVNARLASLGYTALSELGGVRYVWEVGASADRDPQGESHIVRGELWFATHWLNYGPNGYTADMVHNVFG